MPYLEGSCWAGLGLALEGGLEAGKEPGHQGLEGCSQLCGETVGLVTGTVVESPLRGAQTIRWEDSAYNIYAPRDGRVAVGATSWGKGRRVVHTNQKE